MTRYGTNLCRPIRGLGCVGCRSHGVTPVYTRGYNMSSRWDYCRLKAILRNVTRGAKVTMPVLKDQRSDSLPSPLGR